MNERRPSSRRRPRCISSTAAVTSASSGMSATSCGTPLAITRVRAVRDLRRRRIALTELPREDDLLRVDMRRCERGDPAVVVDEVDRHQSAIRGTASRATSCELGARSRASARARRRRRAGSAAPPRSACGRRCRSRCRSRSRSRRRRCGSARRGRGASGRCRRRRGSGTRPRRRSPSSSVCSRRRMGARRSSGCVTRDHASVVELVRRHAGVLEPAPVVVRRAAAARPSRRSAASRRRAAGTARRSRGGAAASSCAASCSACSRSCWFFSQSSTKTATFARRMSGLNGLKT